MTNPHAKSPSLDDFLLLDGLEALADAYGEREDIPLSRSILATARGDWTVRAREAAAGRERPEKLAPVLARRGDTTYAIFGVLHGVVGGDGPAYREFVAHAITDLDDLVIENGLNRLYPCKDEEVIPDFAVLGILGGLWVGIQVGIAFPLLIWEAIKEWRGFGIPEGDGIAYGVQYHASPAEVRRGFEPDPALPTRLEVADALSRHGWRARRVDPFAIVERSLFMAGYAAGVAERKERARVSLLVGDRHTTEIALFLEEPHWAEHPLFQSGRHFALLGDTARWLRFRWAKTVHLSCSATAGSLPLVAVLILIQWLLIR